MRDVLIDTDTPPTTPCRSSWPLGAEVRALAAKARSCYKQSMHIGPPDPVLSQFHAALSEVYGGQLERVVLYGSRARGEARPDSDYDIAVFLRDMPDRAAELERLADIATDILYDSGKFIHATPYRAGAYNDRTPLMHEIREDGVDL